MSKFKTGDKLKSTFTGMGIQFGKVYEVLPPDYLLNGFVTICNDEGHVEFYNEGYFVLVS